MNPLDAARRSFPLLGLALLAGLASAPAQAQNLVQNPGFETGDFSGWTKTLATDGGSDLAVAGGVFVASGSYGARFGSTGAQDDSISQSIPTVAGDDYAVSFSLENLGPRSNDFTASFGGAPLFSIRDSASSPYTQYSFTAAATGASTALTFAGRQVPSYFGLDDVRVTDLGAAPVPESSTTVSFGLLLALGLGGLARAAKRRRAAPSC